MHTKIRRHRIALIVIFAILQSACGGGDGGSPADTVAPEITLNGDSNLTVSHGSNYMELGATALDNVDGDISADVVITGSVDTNAVGIYTLEYEVTDSAGNSSATLTRQVSVVDTTPPTLTLNGNLEIQIYSGETYVDPGANALDLVDGDVSASIASSGDVDTTTVGAYIINYTVSDSAGNAAAQSRVVLVTNPFSNRITYPLPNALLNGEIVIAETTVTGEVQHALNRAVTRDDIESINVNGVEVQLNEETPELWRVSIPVDASTMQVNIDVMYANSANEESRQNLYYQPILDEPNDAHLDAANNRLLVVDPVKESLVSVNLDNGSRSVISNINFGNGPAFSSPTELTLDTQNSAYIVDENTSRIFRVDLTTGNRSIVSDTPDAGGPPASYVSDIAWGNQLYVLELVSQALLAVDTASGERLVVSDASTGNGPPFSAPVALTIGSENQAYVFDRANETLMSVDLSTGDRAVISDSTTGIGPELRDFTDFALDEENNRILAMDASISGFFGQVIAIDLETGNRTRLSWNEEGTGTELLYPTSINVDSDHNRALIVDQRREMIVAMDLETSFRSTLSSSAVGSGSVISRPHIQYDPLNDRLVTASFRAITEVDLTTGERATLSSENVGSGRDFQQILGLALDPANNIAYAADNLEASVFSVNLSNGNRNVVSSNSIGDGPSLSPLNRGIEYDRENNHVLLGLGFTNPAIVSVDPASGHRTVVSGTDIGNGDVLDEPGDVHLMNDTSEVIIYDGNTQHLVKVNIENGNRMAILESTTGEYDVRTGIAIDKTAGELFFSDQSSAHIIGVDIASEATRLFPLHFYRLHYDNPVDLTVDEKNKRLFFSTRHSLILMDLTSGEQVIIGRN